MMLNKKRFEKLQLAIQARTGRKTGLNVTLDKMRYSERAFLGAAAFENALYVGVGHGHDAALALIGGRVKQLDGVDPFYGEHGNDDVDYENLLELIKELSLCDRFSIHKSRIETFLASCDHRYDLVVLPDVLHHIFVTEEILYQTDLFGHCVTLFQMLHNVAEPNCLMAISEAPCSGLRPALVKHGVLNSKVEYQTKQPAIEWRRAAEQAGWKFEGSAAYVPFALRRFSAMLKLKPLDWFYSTRYFLKFRKNK